MGKRRHEVTVDIGLRLPHSKGTIEFMKKYSYDLYLRLMEIDGENDA